MEFRQSNKLRDVCYEIRGPVVEQANLLEEAGHSVLRLNTGNPALFDFEAPEEIVQDMIRMLPQAHGYTDSRGVLPARRAVAGRYQARGLDVDVDDVFLGNGVSELISMAVQALVEDGDEVLMPAPDYPLWTAVATLAGGQAPCTTAATSQADWFPDLDDIAAKITDRTKALVIINPNNPTGAVYSKEVLEGLLDLARRHGLMVMADEIYDQMLYDDAVHHDVASLAPDLVVLTFSRALEDLPRGRLPVGLAGGHRADASTPATTSRAWRCWPPCACARTPRRSTRSRPRWAGVRRSATSPPPAGGSTSSASGRGTGLNDIPGVSCVKPRGALYAFPRLDPERYPIKDDEQFVLDLLREEKIQVVQGTGFNWPTPDHFRILTLPHAETLDDAITRIGRFLETYRQE